MDEELTVCSSIVLVKMFMHIYHSQKIKQKKSPVGLKLFFFFVFFLNFGSVFPLTTWGLHGQRWLVDLPFNSLKECLLNRRKLTGCQVMNYLKCPETRWEGRRELPSNQETALSRPVGTTLPHPPISEWRFLGCADILLLLWRDRS